MPSSSKPKSAARRHASRARPTASKAAKKAKGHGPPAKRTAARPAARSRPSPPAARPAAKKPAPVTAPVVEPLPPRGDGRRHVLSLSFLRDGDEFLARLETDSGQITELKNRSLDQLLSLVANELEDLLE